MKRPLQILILLTMCIPAQAQFSMKGYEFARIAKSASPKVHVRAIEPSVRQARSLLYRSTDSSDTPDTLSYDRFGNLTEQISDYQRKINQYDAQTGTVLLNSISYSRTDKDASWQEEYADQRTTLNAQGIRTAIESSDYKEIRLDEKGHVVFHDDSEGDDEIDRATYTWDGDRLKSLFAEFRSVENGQEHTQLTIENIEIIYESQPFRPYEINYCDYFMDLGSCGVAYNATGIVTIGGVTQDITVKSKVSPDKKSITAEHVMGYLNLTETLTYTDDYGSFSYESSSSDSFLNIVASYNQYGDLISSSYKLINDGTSENQTFYVWTYSDGKPVKRETYEIHNGKPEELGTEQFTAWYDGSGIRNTQNDLKGKVLEATLFTLSGTLLKTLQPQEVDRACESLNKGIYLLQIRTTEGIVVKKLIK